MIFQFHTFLIFINNKKQINGIAILFKLLIKLFNVTRNFINIELSEKFHWKFRWNYIDKMSLFSKISL